MQRTLLTLALIASAGVAHVQAAEPLDPYGRPLVGRNDWVRQPADRPGPATGMTAQAPGMAHPGMTTSPAMPSQAPVPYSATAPAAGEPRDPYGRPFIGRNDFVRQPGDRPGPTGAAPAYPAGSSTAQAPVPSTMGTGAMGAGPMASGPRGVAFKDEYGFRYDAQGNRLDARGNIISPHTR